MKWFVLLDMASRRGIPSCASSVEYWEWPSHWKELLYCACFLSSSSFFCTGCRTPLTCTPNPTIYLEEGSNRIGSVITARKPSLRRLCFYTCLSFCPRGRGGACPGGGACSGCVYPGGCLAWGDACPGGSAQGEGGV